MECNKATEAVKKPEGNLQAVGSFYHFQLSLNR